MTTTNTRPLTINDAQDLTYLIHAAQNRSTFGRALPDGTVVYGTVGPICDFFGQPVFDDRDIRDCYLRVELDLTVGGQLIWPIAELMPEVRTAHFMTNITKTD